MPSLRLFIAWLLLLALPLQAMAAASMKPCVQAQQQHAAVFAMAEPAAHPADTQHHGHDQHRGDAGEATADADHAFADDSSSLGLATPASHDAGHICAICAGLCHGMAVTSEPPRLRLGVPAAKGPGDAPQRLASVTTALPDKPPRA